MKKKVGGIISIVVLIPVLLFVAGIVAQFIINCGMHCNTSKTVFCRSEL